jgi:hypothetical protein
MHVINLALRQGSPPVRSFPLCMKILELAVLLDAQRELSMSAVVPSACATCQAYICKCTAAVHCSWDPEVPENAMVNADSAPTYPETLEEGHARYLTALQEVADRHRPHNVLVVTHGEAIRQSVTRVVRNCSQSCISPRDAPWSTWVM